MAEAAKKYPFENLVLSGGGIWGLAYAGVAQVLAEEGIYAGIRRIAGVSSGAIFATLICLGYEPEDIISILHETDFHSFEDKPNFFRLFHKYAIFAGDALLEWLEELVAKSPAGDGNPGLTFQELLEKNGRELYVFATDLNTQTYREFSARTRPNMKIVHAVRASASLPLVFKAWRFPAEYGHMNIYCDGGMMNNYPIGFFDAPHFCRKGELANERTLGFLFLAPPANAERPDDGLVYGELHAYLKALLESIIVGVSVSLQTSDNVERTVMTPIHDTGISPIHFKINAKEIEALLEVGSKSIRAYLKEYSERYETVNGRQGVSAK
jgi:NTE family protein